MTEPRVSDHALIRYIERVLGYDLDPVRKHLWEKVEGAAGVGASSITVDGFTVVLSGSGSVITVLEPRMRPKRERSTPASPSADSRPGRRG